MRAVLAILMVISILAPTVAEAKTPGRNMLAHKPPYWSALPYLLTAWLAVSGASGQEIHFSPEERLDTIDAALIATAKRSIDLASYAFTDPIVLDALNEAEHRGVVIRIVLDPRERHDFVKLGDLSDSVKIKRGGPFMHLKARSMALFCARARRTSAGAARTRRTMT